MEIQNLTQGSQEWQLFRQRHFGSSEAAAMLGLSPYVSRTELLHMKATGTPQEFSDWVQKNILDYGHEVEAAGRPLAEQVVGTELYPVTCKDGLLSASCDGLTLAEDEGWEHKQWNEELAALVDEGIVPDTHMPQVQQQLMVTGAARWLFMVSDGTPERMVHTWVMPDQTWFERIRAGWNQFEIDLVNYEPKDLPAKPQAEAIMALPALAIQITGKVASSNLPVFQAKAEQFIASIKTELLTDEDFANAEETVKFCEKAEKDLDVTKRAALEQTADIAELLRTIDHIGAQLRDKRLVLTRTIKDKKELIKATILAGVKQKFADHVAALEAEIAPLRLVYQARDFASAMKNKRTLVTLHDAVDTELANAKIAVDAIAQAVRGRLSWYRENAAGFEFLFADLQTLIQKPDEDFQLAVRARVENHQRIEAEKAEQQRQAELQTQAVLAVEQAPAEPEQAEPAPAPQLEVVRTEPAVAHLAPTLRLGQITERLGFALTADFLRTLGFEPAARDKAAMLYHEADFAHICAALIRHIRAAQEKLAA